MTEETPSAITRTVLGDIEPSQMGATLPHEHLQGIVDVYWYPGDDPMSDPNPDATPRLDNLWHWLENPVANRGNMYMTDEKVTVGEMAILANIGIGTVVNLTPIGMYRNPEGLRRISQETGTHIVAGTAFYQKVGHPEGLADWSQDEIAQRFIDDITVGMDGTDIRAGIIGEVGLSWPVDPVEDRVLAASVDAQRATGAALSIHNPYYVNGAEALAHIAKRLAELGADMSRVIMGHCDGFTRSPDFVPLAKDYGFYIELDIFGQVGYEAEVDFTYPGDADRIDAIIGLVDAGLANRVLLSQDIVFKTTLMAYGGHGLGYIHRTVKPWLERRGVPARALEQIFVTNAQTVIPFVPKA